MSSGPVAPAFAGDGPARQSWLAPVLTGLLLALSFPSFGHPLYAWVALVPLAIVSVRAPSWRAAWWRGIVAGAVFFAGLLPWIPQVMVRYGDLSPLTAWGLQGVLVAYLAVFPGAFALGLRMARDVRGDLALLTTPVFWVASEMGRLHLFVGFPWELLGYSQVPWLPVVQLASVAGVMGVSALVALVNGVVAYGLVARGRRRWYPAACGVALVTVTVASGAWRLQTAVEHEETTRVAAVQGNVAQAEKWDARLAERHLRTHLELTRQAAAAGAEIVAWPEAAVPFPLLTDDRASAVRALARELGVTLHVGTTDVEHRGDARRRYNAAVTIEPDGRTVAVYRKQQLVPWGEYVPLGDWLVFVSPLVHQVGGFSPGSGPVVATLGAGVLATAICYEIIYPGLVRGLVRSGAGLLTTLTNDAWYGRSAAPHQHFQMARMRAIEQGRYLLRAANTGISGIVDPYGRVVARTSLFESTVVVEDVGWRSELTPYARHGDVVGRASVVLAALLFGVAVPWRGSRTTVGPERETRP